MSFPCVLLMTCCSSKFKGLLKSDSGESCIVNPGGCNSYFQFYALLLTAPIKRVHAPLRVLLNFIKRCM